VTVKVTLDPTTMDAQVTDQEGRCVWSGRCPPYLSQWMAGRRVAFFRSTDTAVLSPSGLVGILGESEDKW
jgi:hypothetical protein